MLRVVEDHLRSNQVSRVIYGSIIGLALVVALEPDPPRPAVMIGTLAGTGVAVGLAELYSELVGTEVRTRRRVDRARVRAVMTDVRGNWASTWIVATCPACTRQAFASSMLARTQT